MSNSINAYYQYAQLSMAAYANLTAGISGQAYINALKSQNFTDALAQEFTSPSKGYTILSQRREA